MERVFNILWQSGSLRAIPLLQSFYCPVAKVVQIGLPIRRSFYHQVSDEGAGPHLYEAQRALIPYPLGRLSRTLLAVSQVLHDEPDSVLYAGERGNYLRYQTTGPLIIRVR